MKLHLSGLKSRKDAKKLEECFNTVTNITLAADHEKNMAVLIARRDISEYEIRNIAASVGVSIETIEYV